MSNFLKRTWAQISLDNISHNFHSIKSMLNDGVKVMSVVKADAYGHGVQYVAPLLDKLGTDWFAVSNIEEALQLREIGIEKPVLILGYTPPEMANLLADNNISQALLNEEYGAALSAAAEKCGKTVKVHVKIDSGMGRIGFVHHSADDNTAFNEIMRVHSLGSLDFEGIFTHFASSDTDGDESGEYTAHQFNMFCDIIDKLRQSGITFRLRHCCNSAATLNNKAMQLDMVRPGIILYGLEPSSYFRGKNDLIPAMTLKSVISMIKTVNAGECISYGRTYTADRAITAATVPVGYADGYPRALSNHGYVMIRGKRAPIIGRVCMDQMIVDISGIDGLKTGDEVLLFGSDDNGVFPVEDFAALCGTINYETVCIIGKRVTRVFVHDGKTIGTINYVYKLQ